MNSRSLLLRGARVIDTEPAPVVLEATDVLIEGGRIAAVGRGLAADDAEVLDLAGRIVLPGFVDAHRHLWQTALRASTVDVGLGTYLDLVLGELGPRYEPEDVYAGNLFGAYECLDSGITTVQDYSHDMFTPDHVDAALEGLRTAGIRAVFGAGGAHDDVRRLATAVFPGLDGRLTLALAPAGPSYSPVEQVRADWLLARELGLRIAVHVGAGPVAERPIKMLAREGLLTADTTYVHGNSLPDDELRRIADSGGTVVIAPAVEAQMGHGAPMANRLRAAGVPTGLGADVVTAVAGDMFSLMRATLLSSQLSPGPRLSAADVLRLATIGGATALGMQDEVGSLRPGKRADLLVVRTDATNLTPVGDDVIGLVVAAAQPSDVDTVIVAGEVVKRGGRLVGAELDGAREAVERSARRLMLPARGRA